MKDPLSSVPQIPADYANHIAQGGLWGLALAFALALGAVHVMEWAWSPRILVQVLGAAFLVMLTVSVGKKIFDYFEEGESVQMCALKAAVTVLWPLSLWATNLFTLKGHL